MESLKLECLRCGVLVDPRKYVLSCPNCSGVLVPTVGRINELIRGGEVGIWAWQAYLMPRSRKVTLGEGSTPLIRSVGLGRMMDIAEVLIKNEAKNPTGTFLDRGSATLTSAALEFRVNRLAIASLGDLGISVASYCRRASLKCLTYLPLSTTPSKVYQTLLLSDKVVFVSSYEEAIRRVMKYEPLDIMPTIPTNPYLLEGYRTIYYEIFDFLKEHPDFLVVPVGDGGLYTMLWVALRELGGDSVIVGVKSRYDSPLVKDIAVEKPLLQDLMEVAIKDCGGFIIEVSESDLIEATRLLAREEGLIAEPAGAAAIAALIKSQNSFDRNSKVVAVVTGAALTDAATLRIIVNNKHLEVTDFLRVGFTKSLILEVLAVHGPMHVYALWKIIREYRGLKLSLRALYQHVKELERLGMVRVVSEEVVEGRRRKVYEVTEKGLKVIS